MTDLWSGFEHDPRSPEYAPMRAADRDRDLILGALGDAFAEGRLTREEYDERSDQLAATRTLGDLPVLVSDLIPKAHLVPRSAPGMSSTPAGIFQKAVAKFEKERRESLSVFLGVSALCWMIWVTIGIGPGDFNYPWPLWVMLGTGINAGRVLFTRTQIVEAETRKLERRAEKVRRKELGKPNDVA